MHRCRGVGTEGYGRVFIDTHAMRRMISGLMYSIARGWFHSTFQIFFLNILVLQQDSGRMLKDVYGLFEHGKMSFAFCLWMFFAGKSCYEKQTFFLYM